MELNEFDYKCSICYEYYFQPVTLECGHTFCSFCISQFAVTKKFLLKCALCSQIFQKVPKVNITLQNYLNATYPKEMSERAAIFDTDEIEELRNHANSKKTIYEFLEQISPYGPILTCLTYLLTVSWIMIAYIHIAWEASDVPTVTTRLYKPLEDWTPKETYDWLNGLGKWSQKSFLEPARSLSFDGNALLKLDNTQLVNEPFNVDNPIYRNLLLDSISALNKSETPVKWSLETYKEVYQLRSAISLITFLMYPRIFISKLYLHDESIFRQYRDFFNKKVLKVNSTDLKISFRIDLKCVFKLKFDFYISIELMPFYLKNLLSPHVIAILTIYNSFMETNILFTVSFIMSCVVSISIELYVLYNFLKLYR